MDIREKTLNEDIEVELLLTAIYNKYGYDFNKYSRAHITRRVKNRVVLSKFNNISEIQHKVLNDKDFFDLLIGDFSINVTEMFRDPPFYKAFREQIVPILHSYPFIKIWHAGCSTGEEVYSMAILLKEEGLYNNTQIYATDINNDVLKKANDGIFPIENVKLYTKNYQQSGGKEEFSDYYTAGYGSVLINSELKKNINFSNHNLVTDKSFGEMHLIICRNVLIYFNRSLQNQVISLFTDSLINGGFYCQGSKESIHFSDNYKFYETINSKENIYKKKYV